MMSISVQRNNSWLTHCLPDDRNTCRIRKQLATKDGAVVYGRYIKEQAEDKSCLELPYSRTVFNELFRIDEWNGENPLSKIRPYKTDEQEMAFLSDEEIIRLLAECENSSAPHLLPVVKVCLSTGARWSEAEELSGGQVTKNMITFTKTKGKRNRSVPISDDLYTSLPKSKGSKPLFSSCYSAFRTAIKRAEIELPAGQLSHVLRHTFASHFMMNGGNILVLQRILGHTDIKMTMRYAHFAPDHLNDAVMFNPLVRLKI